MGSTFTLVSEDGPGTHHCSDMLRQVSDATNALLKVRTVDPSGSKMMWQLMSSHIHALHLFFYRVGAEHGSGVQATVEEGYKTVILSFVLVSLIGARDEFRDLFDCLREAM